MTAPPCGIAVLIAGGLGSRLAPLTRVLPKRALPIGNIPLQELVAAWLARNGVRGMRVGSSPREPRAPLPDPVATGLEAVDEVREEAPLGTGGFLARAAWGLDGRFLALNGDLLLDAPVAPLWEAAEETDADLLIASRSETDLSRYGVLRCAADGRVLAFEEKPGGAGGPRGVTSAGLYVVHPRLLAAVPPGRSLSLERDLLPEWIATGRRVYTRPLGGDLWRDIGTRESYLAANADAVRGCAGLAVAGQRTRNLLAAEGCQVAEDATAVDWCCLGPRVRIGAAARVARSVLLAGAEVGDGAEVTDSVLGPHAAVHAGEVLRGGLRIGGERPPVPPAGRA